MLLIVPEYQGAVPILDGGEGSSEHVIYGTNVDWKSTEPCTGEVGKLYITALTMTTYPLHSRATRIRIFNRSKRSKN